MSSDNYKLYFPIVLPHKVMLPALQVEPDESIVNVSERIARAYNEH